MMDGIYTLDDVTVKTGAIIRKDIDARPVIVHSDGGAPSVTLGEDSEIHDIWLGGIKPVTDNGRIIRALPGAGMYDCTIWGYINGVAGGSGDDNIYDGCRFVNCGLDWYWHPMYITSYPAGAGATITDSIFVGCKGYAMHFYHEPLNGVVENNFTGHCSAPLAFEGYRHIGSKNIFWNSTSIGLFYTSTLGSSLTRNVFSGVRPDAGVTSADKVFDTNYFMDPLSIIPPSGLGTNPVQWYEADVAANLGDSSANIDAAISALEACFAQTTVQIQADATIETYFTVLSDVIAAWKAVP